MNDGEIESPRVVAMVPRRRREDTIRSFSHVILISEFSAKSR